MKEFHVANRNHGCPQFLSISFPLLKCRFELLIYRSVGLGRVVNLDDFTEIQCQAGYRQYCNTKITRVCVENLYGDRGRFTYHVYIFKYRKEKLQK